MTTCKEWAVPEGFFQGLCSKTYEPLQGTDECPVCVIPTMSPPVVNTCFNTRFLASTPNENVVIPTSLKIEFQSGDMVLRKSYTCERTAEVGVYAKSLIPELVGKVVALPMIDSDNYQQVWETDWIPCGSRFSSYKMIDFATQSVSRYYKESWDIEIRFRLTHNFFDEGFQVCGLLTTFEVRKSNTAVFGSKWFFPGDTGQGAIWEPCDGWQYSGWLWGIPNGTVSDLQNGLAGNDYKVDSPALDPIWHNDTLLAPLNNDINRALPRFHWRFATFNCANNYFGNPFAAFSKYPGLINSIEEEVVCEDFGWYKECKGYISRVWPRYTKPQAEISQCGVVTTFPAWTPGVIVSKITP